MLTYEEALGETRRLLAEWLELAGIAEPPVCLYDIALRLGFSLDNGAPPGLPALALADPRAISLSPTDPAPRRHFSLAHELVEQYVFAGEEAGPATEDLVNACASELLFPEAFWRDAVAELGHDLPRLRERFGLVSYEAVARRMQRDLTAVLTIADNGAITQRLPAVPVAPFERAALQECARLWAPVRREPEPEEVAGAEPRVVCWPVPVVRHAIRRVIALTHDAGAE